MNTPLLKRIKETKGSQIKFPVSQNRIMPYLGTDGKIMDLFSMKKFFFLLAAVVFVSSCGSASASLGIGNTFYKTNNLLKNTATYAPGSAQMFVTPILADLKVSPKKIVYHLEVGENIRMGGEENVIASAVKEALDVEGGDVIVGLEKQLKYDSEGNIQSITITGYPAKYVNFRPCENLPLPAKPEEKESKEGSGLPFFSKSK